MRHHKDNEPMYNMALASSLETRAAECRKITRSVYEHGLYAPSCVGLLDPPFPIEMVHVFAKVKTALIEFKNELLNDGQKQSPAMKGVLHGLEMIGHIEVQDEGLPLDAI